MSETRPGHQPPLTAHQRVRARLHGVWEWLSDVAADADLLTVSVRSDVMEALAYLVAARGALADARKDGHG